MKTAEQCQLAECSSSVEQPTGGGPRKRFCCDSHRLLYWRQSQKESRQQQLQNEKAELPSNSSAVLALRDQLEASVSILEGHLTRARTTLLDLSSLEAAESARKEAFAQAEEQVARVQAEQAAEERRRQAAEALAEAAAARTTELEAQMHINNLQLKNLQAENEQLRQSLEQQAAQARTDLDNAQKEVEKSQAKFLQEIRTEIATRAKAEARAESAEASIIDLKAQLALLRGEPTPSKPKPKATKKTRDRP